MYYLISLWVYVMKLYFPCVSGDVYDVGNKKFSCVASWECLPCLKALIGIECFMRFFVPKNLVKTFSTV